MRAYRGAAYILHQQEFPPHICYFSELTLEAAQRGALNQGLSSIRNIVLTSPKIATADKVEYNML